MIKILIADDHPIVRRGLREIIEDEKDFLVIHEASNSFEVLDGLRNNKVDILLLDISMPGKSGLDLLTDVKKEFPDLKVLMLSGMSEELFAKRAIKSGAQGFLTKESAPELLISAIKKVSDGKRFVSEKLAEIMANELTNFAGSKPHERLSDREFEVLRLLGSGKTVGEISETLNLSVSTISTFRARILDKLHLRNNSELIQYCINENLLSS